MLSVYLIIEHKYSQAMSLKLILYRRESRMMLITTTLETSEGAQHREWMGSLQASKQKYAANRHLRPSRHLQVPDLAHR